MREFIENSVFFGVMVTFASYALGMLLKKRFKTALFNPLLVSIALILVFLLATGVSYDSYAEGADCISYLLTPATICLAVPLYRSEEHTSELQSQR